MINRIKFIFNRDKRIVLLKKRNGSVIFFDQFKQILNASYISKEINENLEIYGQENKPIQFGKLKYSDKDGEVSPDEIYTAEIISIRLYYICNNNPSKQEKEAFILKEIYLRKNSLNSFVISKEELKEKRKGFFA